MELKVGPIIIDIAGLSLTTEDEQLLQHPNLGGCILFSRNYSNVEQLRALTQHIKAIRPNCLICVDQEGGRVQRFIHQFSQLPSMQILGEVYAKAEPSKANQLAEQMGALMAVELRSLGVDLSFAPVVDLATNLNPVVCERAIHAEAEIVANCALAYMKGMQKMGMAACAKHFPGHGQVEADSHLSLPVDSREADDVKSDLYPFQVLIDNAIQAIMPGHLLFPKIDAMPASFSSYWLQTVLRKEMKFTGAIVSDDINMDAARTIGDFKTCANKAIQAGSDMVLVCNNREEARRVLDSAEADFSTSTLERRASLFPSTEAPAWESLAEHPTWQSAQSSLAALNNEL